MRRVHYVEDHRHRGRLIAHCRDHLGRYKIPKKIVFVETLPKNPSGKLLKRDLRDRFGSTFH